jgi:glycosyltransferase involved in cell wall biosynthesis
MKVLVFTTVFPNPSQPLHGLFVMERIRHSAQHAEVRVVSPVEWHMRWSGQAVPKRSDQAGMLVEHPTFFYIPRLFKCLDGLFLFLSALPCVARLRKEFDFDLVDAHFAFPDGCAAALLGWWFRRPVVITERGTLVEIWPHLLRRQAVRWAFRRAERVIAVADCLARRVADLGISPDRIAVIENGVDTVKYTAIDRNEARARLGLQSAGQMLVSVGRLSQEKAFHRVVEALPGVLLDCPNLTYALVGGAVAGGGYARRLRRIIAALGLAQRVALVGPRPPGQIALWLSAADVFVLPSDYEGCPNAVWEALACGRPVVATRVGEVERMVPPFAGILFNPGDGSETLRRCLVDALRRPWDERRIRGHAELHTWDKIATRVMRQWRLAAANRLESDVTVLSREAGRRPSGSGRPMPQVSVTPEGEQG